MFRGNFLLLSLKLWQFQFIASRMEPWRSPPSLTRFEYFILLEFVSLSLPLMTWETFQTRDCHSVCWGSIRAWDTFREIPLFLLNMMPFLSSSSFFSLPLFPVSIPYNLRFGTWKCRDKSSHGDRVLGTNKNSSLGYVIEVCGIRIPASFHQMENWRNWHLIHNWFTSLHCPWVNKSRCYWNHQYPKCILRFISGLFSPYTTSSSITFLFEKINWRISILTSCESN